MDEKKFESICELIAQDSKVFIESFQTYTLSRGYSGDTVSSWDMVDRNFMLQFGIPIGKFGERIDANMKNKAYVFLTEPNHEGKSYLFSSGSTHKDPAGRTNRHFFAIYGDHNLMSQAVDIIYTESDKVGQIEKLLEIVGGWRKNAPTPEGTNVYSTWGERKLMPTTKNVPRLFTNVEEINIMKSSTMPLRIDDTFADVHSVDDMVAALEAKPFGDTRLPKLDIVAKEVASYFGLRAVDATPSWFGSSDSGVQPSKYHLVRDVPPPPSKPFLQRLKFWEKDPVLPYKDGDLVATLEYLQKDQNNPMDDKFPIVKLTLHEDGYAGNFDGDYFKLFSVPTGRSSYTHPSSFMFDYSIRNKSGCFIASTNDIDHPMRNDPTFMENYVPLVLTSYMKSSGYSHNGSPELVQKLARLREQASLNPEMAHSMN